MTTPTPEQLQAWRVKFESGFQYKPTVDDDGDYLDNTQVMWRGYLRRCQETEQIMKLAKFGAMAARKWINDALDSLVYPDLDVALVESIVMDIISEKDRDLSPEIKNTIKDLLND